MFAALARWRWKPWAVSLGLFGLALVAWQAYQDLAPLLVRKRVTVSIAREGAVRFIYANAQPHNEIVYDMKTRWVPRMEQDPKAYTGREISEPYDSYLTQHLGAWGLKHLALALPALLLMGAGLARRPATAAAVPRDWLS